MAFFQRNFHTPDTSFTPLFRLLDDFDTYSKQGGTGATGGQHHGPGRRHQSLAHWTPKFDVRETDTNYELHGELPGMSKEDVHIEFTDPQTMQIRGRVERSYTSGTPPAVAGHIEGSTEQAAITGDEEKAATATSTSNNVPHKATVEDEDAASTTATTGGEVTKTTSGTDVSEPTTSKHSDTAKYWLTERSVGEFSRNFSFPSRVSQDGVTASFKDGILSIVVPKAKHESRRIAIA